VRDAVAGEDAARDAVVTKDAVAGEGAVMAVAEDAVVAVVAVEDEPPC
jgi:hypothetical protein